MASFMEIVPRLYKSSVVFIPANMKTDIHDFIAYGFTLDNAAQSYIAYSYDMEERAEPIEVTSSSEHFNKLWFFFVFF